MKKDDVIGLLIAMGIMIVLLLAIIWRFNYDANKCDKEKGYECSASQIIEQNKKVD